MILQACLNGARPRGFHARLPTDPRAIAEDAAAAVRAGAGELHLHVRAPDGRESLAPEDVAATLRAVRARVPGTLVGVSTGAWIERDDERRLGLVDAWTELPDHASVNLAERGAPHLMERLRARGVAIEAGLASSDDAERLVALRLDRMALRILVELEEQDARDAEAQADPILKLLRRAACTKPILLHSMEATAWTIVERAFRQGFSTRIGLEDTRLLPDGSIAPSNEALIRAAVAIRAQVQ